MEQFLVVISNRFGSLGTTPSPPSPSHALEAMEQQKTRETHHQGEMRRRKGGRAHLLKRHLSRLDLDYWKGTTLKFVSAGGLIAVAASAALSPNGPGICDHNRTERCANCLTSVPYAACGWHAFRNRRTTAGKVWGASLMGVGACSGIFHASSGSVRPACRRMDFWSIAAASNMMVKAVFPSVPPIVTALGMAATPFRPFIVSSINGAAMEIKYLVESRRKRHLRRPQRIHAATCLLGLGCFVLEEFFPKLPLMHAAWHCLSATAVATINHLVADVEDVQLGARMPVQQLVL